jgi:hypothetical protein
MQRTFVVKESEFLIGLTSFARFCTPLCSLLFRGDLNEIHLRRISVNCAVLYEKLPDRRKDREKQGRARPRGMVRSA